MNPLEQLIATAKAKIATEAAAKAATAGVKTAKTAEAREKSLLESRRLQNELDWRPHSLVFVVEDWECACGTTGHNPGGMFIYKRHTRMANASTLSAVRNESEGNQLPRLVKFTEKFVAVCHACCLSLGFDDELVETRIPLTPATSTPGEFTQEWETLRAPLDEVDEDDTPAEEDSNDDDA